MVLAIKKIPPTDTTEFNAQRTSRVGIFPANAAASNTRIQYKRCHFSSPFSDEIFVEERQLEGRSICKNYLGTDHTGGRHNEHVDPSGRVLTL
jgi:hypothetical protein